MNIDEYETIRIEEVKQFARTWKENNIKDPENYPMDMPEGEWAEQERLVIEYGD